MSGAIGVAIQLGNALALDKVQYENRTRGLTVSQHHHVPPIQAHPPVNVDIDDEQSSDDSDHEQDQPRFPDDHPLIRAYGARVIIPRSFLASQSRSQSNAIDVHNNVGRGGVDDNGNAHLLADDAAG